MYWYYIFGCVDLKESTVVHLMFHTGPYHGHEPLKSTCFKFLLYIHSGTFS